MNTGEFPKYLQNANVAPVFKKNKPLNKENYTLVSILPIVLKVLEKLMQNQVNLHIEFFMLSYLCGYRKGFNSQHVNISTIL